jgi:hypothetical protein
MVDLPYNESDFWETAALWFVNVYVAALFVTTGKRQISRAELCAYVEDAELVFAPLLQTLKRDHKELAHRAIEWGRSTDDANTLIDTVQDFWENFWMPLPESCRTRVRTKAAFLIEAQRRGKSEEGREPSEPQPI